MKIAIVHKDDEIIVSFEERKFRELLKKFMEEYNDIDKSFEEIIKLLKKQLLTK
ncbi:MAG: hypothetical protein KKB31_07170 [Nanoarchaeota archaeon]|nr:hypothetical protein [Nanoarchaeota archaeon]